MGALIGNFFPFIIDFLASCDIIKSYKIIIVTVMKIILRREVPS